MSKKLISLHHHIPQALGSAQQNRGIRPPPHHISSYKTKNQQVASNSGKITVNCY